MLITGNSSGPRLLASNQVLHATAQRSLSMDGGRLIITTPGNSNPTVPVRQQNICRATQQKISYQMSSQQGTVKVSFAIRKQVPFGRVVALAGSLPQLGRWLTSAAFTLEWTDDHVWQGTLDVPKEHLHVPFEIKAVVLQANLAVEWEDGGNRVVSVIEKHPAALISPPGTATITCKWEWNHAGPPEVRVELVPLSTVSGRDLGGRKASPMGKAERQSYPRRRGMATPTPYMRSPPPAPAPVIPPVPAYGYVEDDDEVQLVDGPVRAFAEPETRIHPRVSKARAAPKRPARTIPMNVEAAPQQPVQTFQPKFDPEVTAWAEHPSKMSKEQERQLVNALSPEYQELLGIGKDMPDDEAELGSTCGGTVIVKLQRPQNVTNKQKDDLKEKLMEGFASLFGGKRR